MSSRRVRVTQSNPVSKIKTTKKRRCWFSRYALKIGSAEVALGPECGKAKNSNPIINMDPIGQHLILLIIQILLVQWQNLAKAIETPNNKMSSTCSEWPDDDSLVLLYIQGYSFSSSSKVCGSHGAGVLPWPNIVPSDSSLFLKNLSSTTKELRISFISMRKTQIHRSFSQYKILWILQTGKTYPI